MTHPALARQRAAAAIKAKKTAFEAFRLVAIRKAMGLTQAQLAQHFKVGLRTLLRWETDGLRHGPEAVLYSLLERGIWHP